MPDSDSDSDSCYHFSKYGFSSAAAPAATVDYEYQAKEDDDEGDNFLDAMETEIAVCATQEMDGLASIDDLVAEEFNRFDSMPSLSL